VSHSATRQRGQILPVAAFGILIAGAALVLMFNTGQKVTEKSQVANAADAAAYSAGVWTARHLNYMAYTNRAMVANHVAVGHYVSYISWFRYIEYSIDTIQDYTSWVPYWGAFINVAERIVTTVQQVNDRVAAVLVPAMDGLNSLYRASQLETAASLAYGGVTGLDRLMEETAHTYDNRIAVNDTADLRALPGVLSAPLIAKVQYQRVELPRFVERYTAGRDDGRITQLITNTIRGNSNNRNWIEGNRGWNLGLLVIRFRKQGATRHSQDGNGAEWDAVDRAQVATRRGFRWGRWRNIGSELGSATASEFDSNYEGVPNYYNLRGRVSDNNSLDIAAVAAKRQNAVATKQILSMTTTAQPMMVAAVAKVEFSRPSPGLGFPDHGSNRDEYANLFNPFWEAHLTDIDVPGI
jgi:Putative Flp pilus-assembly TadE/G-like